MVHALTDQRFSNNTDDAACFVQAASAGAWLGERTVPLGGLAGDGGPGRYFAEVFADGGVQAALVVVVLAVAGH